MTKWLLAGVAMISAVIAAEPPNRQFRFGSFEVTAVQDASSAMRAELFPGIPGTDDCYLHGSFHLRKPDSGKDCITFLIR